MPTQTRNARTVTRAKNTRDRHKQVFDFYRKMSKIVENGKQVYSHEHMVNKTARAFCYSYSTVEKIISEFNS